MPKEIRDSAQFQKLMLKGHELRVVRAKDYVKLKLRTPEYLYVYKTNEDEAEDILKSAKDLEVVELTPKKEEKKTEGKQESK